MKVFLFLFLLISIYSIETDNPDWTIMKGLAVYNYKQRVDYDENIKYLLAFDMDDTLITSAKGKERSTLQDWKYAYTNISDKINERISGYPEGTVAIAILSNQGDIGITWKNLRPKVEFIISDEFKEFKIICLFANGGLTKKPNTGMLEYLKQNYYPNIQSINSVYVGDAAGRTHPNGYVDFKDTDKLFAKKAKMQFETPEEFFGEENKTFERFPK